MKSSPGIMSGTSYFSASWPGLTRPSTPSCRFQKTWMPGSSPGMTTLMVLPTSSDRLVDGDELRSVRKRRLDLDVVDHLRNTRHHLLAPQHLGAGLHQVGDGAAVACAL